jgi:hypothetical protein
VLLNIGELVCFKTGLEKPLYVVGRILQTFEESTVVSVDVDGAIYYVEYIQLGIINFQLPP